MRLRTLAAVLCALSVAQSADERRLTLRLSPRALQRDGEPTRVWIVLDGDHPLGRTPGPLQGQLTCGDRRIPCFTEFPLPWPDGRTAAGVSWRGEDTHPQTEPLLLTLQPGFSPPIEGIVPINLWPDPHLGRPVHTGARNCRPNAWWFGGSGRARQYERKVAIVEQESERGRAIRIETSKPGNWSLVLRQRQNLAVTPGQAYLFSVRYKTPTDLAGYLRIYYVGRDGKLLQQHNLVLSRKPRVFWAGERWRTWSLGFTAPEDAAGALGYIKVADAGVLWVSGVAVVPVYEPMFTVATLDEEYSWSETSAVFKVDTILGRAALLPVCMVHGAQAWLVSEVPKGTPTQLFVRVGEAGQEQAVVISRQGIAKVKLPGKPGDLDVRFRLCDADGQTLAAVRRAVRVRRTVLD